MVLRFLNSIFLLQKYNLDFVIDLHASSSMLGVFIQGNSYDSVYRYERHIVFPKMLAQNMPDFSQAQTFYNADLDKEGTAIRYYLTSCLFKGGIISTCIFSLVPFSNKGVVILECILVPNWKYQYVLMNLPRESNLPQLTSTYLQAKVEMLSMHTFFHDGTKVKTTFENKPPLLMFIPSKFQCLVMSKRQTWTPQILSQFTLILKKTVSLH